MRNPTLGPLRFQPILKRLIWGGRRLGTTLGKGIGPESDYAESWEIADHGHDVSRVASGPWMGRDLRELLRLGRRDLLGEAVGDRDHFPLLVKFLDARQTLSVQVHPDDDLAARLVQDRGKTEAWVILDAEPGSLIYAGLKPGVDRDHFAQAMNQGTEAVEPLLHRFEPRPGDVVFIPAGTVHAIGAGILLTEIQQMSDATFRVDDWGRLDAQGQPRPLHRAEALQAIDFNRGPVDPVPTTPQPIPGGTYERLIECPYFLIERWVLHRATVLGRPDRFTIVVGLEGRGRLIDRDHLGHPLKAGQTLLLPAAAGRCLMAPEVDCTLRVLTCTVP